MRGLIRRMTASAEIPALNNFNTGAGIPVLNNSNSGAGPSSSSTSTDSSPSYTTDSSEQRRNLFTQRRGRISASLLPLPYNPGRSYGNNNKRAARRGRHSNGSRHVSVASNSTDKKERKK